MSNKWVALSNTTLGLLMATINSSIVLIAMPDIFRGIGIDPLAPGNTSYLLWMIMGFLVVTAVLVVGFGRLGAVAIADNLEDPFALVDLLAQHRPKIAGFGPKDLLPDRLVTQERQGVSR